MVMDWQGENSEGEKIADPSIIAGIKENSFSQDTEIAIARWKHTSVELRTKAIANAGARIASFIRSS